MAAFSRGDYARALEQNTMAETISKVLYPADDHIEGKRLRLKQQYLLVSASLQSILKEHCKQYGTLSNLADKVAVHINDTHPALCVPELMRLLVDQYEMGWDEAWRSPASACPIRTIRSWQRRSSIGRSTCSVSSCRAYTALSARLTGARATGFSLPIPATGRRSIIWRPSPAARCAWQICPAACHKVNGVSQLHTQILKDGIFRDYAQLDESRFINVTNGIAYRRWLCQANPALTDYLTKLIGDGFTKDARELEKLLGFYDNEEVSSQLRAIKLENKKRLAAYEAAQTASISTRKACLTYRSSGCTSISGSF